MSHPPFEFPISDPALAAFADGEMILSPTDIPGTPAAAYGVYYLAKLLPLPPGLYTIKVFADDNVTVRYGRDAKSLRAVHRSSTTDGVVSSEFRAFGGEKRLDVRLTNSGPSASACYMALSIWRGNTLVYTSSDDGWLVDTVAIPDADLDQPTVFHPVLTITPNWGPGITERLSWQTDILTSETGVEQRRAVRIFPRRSFEANFLRAKDKRSLLDNFVMGIGRRQFLLPLWHEQYRVTAPILMSTTGVFLPAESAVDREFRPGDNVLIQNGDPHDFEIVGINAINVATGAITWNVAPTRAWPAGTRITPCRLARIIDDATLTNATDAIGSAQLRFELVEPDDQFCDPADDPETVALSAPAWDYCAPLWQFQPNRATEVAATYSRLDVTLDNQVGPVDIVDTSGQAWLGQKFNILLRGREEVFRFRRFIAMARGRAVRFYMPSFLNDVQPLEDIAAGDTFDVKPAGLARYMEQAQNTRAMIAIVFRDDAPTVYRNVTAVTEQVDSFAVIAESITVDQDLPAVARSLIKRIEWVTVARFDQDTFELHHHVDNSNAVAAAIVTRSVDATDMEPIDCWITSRPYPLIVSESVSASVTLESGRLLGAIPMDDEVTASIVVESGDLNQILLDYSNWPDVPEEVTATSIVVESGELRQILKDYSNWPDVPEEVTASIVVESGSLDTILITYSRWPDVPEEIAGTVTLESGSLD